MAKISTMHAKLLPPRKKTFKAYAKSVIIIMPSKQIINCCHRKNLSIDHNFFSLKMLKYSYKIFQKKRNDFTPI